MGKRFWFANGVLLAAMAWMGTFGGMEVAAARVLPEANAKASIEQLEAGAARAPNDPSTVAALATAYLDRAQPGLATAVLEKAPREVRDRPEVAHLYARALFHRGHVREALAVARDASDSCESFHCPSWLVAKTVRQVAFFEQVVAAGIHDPQDDPGATIAAYERSTHEVRLVAMR